jgi:hypothetical protein
MMNTTDYEIMRTINPPADAIDRCFACIICDQVIGAGPILEVWHDGTGRSYLAHPVHFEQPTRHQLIKRLAAQGVGA